MLVQSALQTASVDKCHWKSVQYCDQTPLLENPCGRSLMAQWTLVDICVNCPNIHFHWPHHQKQPVYVP